jgi:hypothetical protein
MLVCSVSLRPQRHTIAAALEEAGSAFDVPSIDAIFATLTDDPGNARDILDAFSGQRMVETANAAVTLDAESTHPAVVLEEISAAVAAQDAGLVAAVTYATWDAATVAAVTLSGGNLIATNTGKNSADQGARVASTNAKTTGKYYFEATFITITGGANLGVGIGTTTSTYTGIGTNATTGNNGLRTGAIWANGANTGVSVGIYSNAQVAGVAVDLDNHKIWFRHSPSGNWNGNASYNPATNTGGITIPAGAMVPFVTFGGTPGGAANNVVAADFGASVFSGTVPSGFTAGWPTGAIAVERDSMVGTVFVNSDGTARQANAEGIMINL